VVGGSLYLYKRKSVFDSKNFPKNVAKMTASPVYCLWRQFMLGNNRDYKSNADRVTRNLKLTATLAAEYEKEGLSHDAAVEKAANFVLYPIRTLKPLASGFYRAGIGERQFVESIPYPEFHKAARKAYRAIKAEAEGK
jgi:hypothetical protein